MFGPGVSTMPSATRAKAARLAASGMNGTSVEERMGRVTAICSDIALAATCFSINLPQIASLEKTG